MEFSFFLFFVFGTQYHSNLPFLQSQAMSFFFLHKVNIKAFFFLFFLFFLSLSIASNLVIFFPTMKACTTTKPFFLFSFFLFSTLKTLNLHTHGYYLFIYLLFFTSEIIIFSIYLFI